jgi:hypothetical protein
VSRNSRSEGVDGVGRVVTDDGLLEVAQELCDLRQGVLLVGKDDAGVAVVGEEEHRSSVPGETTVGIHLA